MRGLNRITLIGNVGRDPEMRFTAEGKAVADLSLAVSTGGVENERTVWFKIVCWEKLAEIVNEHVGKGTRIYLEGRFAPREFQDRQGQTRTSLDVIADRVLFLDRKVPAAAGEPEVVAGTEAPGEPEADREEQDGDIPF